MPTTRKSASFPIGKVPPGSLVRAVYSHVGRRNPRLLLGPGIGRDTAIVRDGKRVIVFTADPVTGTTRDIGEHSVQINANDIATAGARPVWYMCTLLLPPGTSENTLEEIMKGVDSASRKLGVTVLGGHTEATRGLDRPIIAGFMVGESSTDVLSSQGAHVGDVMLLTKSAGLEGTAIIASDYEEQLKHVPGDLLARARSFSKKISIVKEALSIAKIRGVHALHDPTEGGVLNGFWEMAEASRLGIEIWADQIPVAEETRRICSILRLDPLKLMSSGCLLAAVDRSAVSKVAMTLRSLRVRVSEVGRMTAKRKGRYMIQGSKRRPLIAVPRDELYKMIQPPRGWVDSR